MESCKHIKQIKVTNSDAKGCKECLKTGDEWVHLRLCLTCGHVGCCNQSKNKHAEKYFHETKHPLIKSFEEGEEWGWCWEDEVFFEDILNNPKPVKI